MIKDIRRKVANAISPEKSKSYPLVELKWATPQSENERYLKLVYKRFEKEYGRKPLSDEEAWEYNRKRIKELEQKYTLDSKNQG